MAGGLIAAGVALGIVLLSGGAGLLGHFWNPPLPASAPRQVIPRDEIAPAEIPEEQPGIRVDSAAKLVELLGNCSFRGRVIIPKDADWKMERCDKNGVCTPLIDIPIYSNVQLVGERGDLGSRPRLFTTIVDPDNRHALFEVKGNDVLVQGLHLQGPQMGRDHATQNEYVHGILVNEKAEEGTIPWCQPEPFKGARQQSGRRVLIVDNEFNEWTGGAVSVIGGHFNSPLNEWKGHTCIDNAKCCDACVPADGEKCWQPLTQADVDLVRVERNFMHHNARDGGGYGVNVDGGAYVKIMGNVFSFNRHAVTASGRAYSGYTALFNYVLEGGYCEDSSTTCYYNQHFDVHGEGDGGYGGAAGTYFQIAFNTIRGEQSYYLIKTRPALLQRGIPAEGMDFFHNVLVHNSRDAAVDFKGIPLAPHQSFLTRAKFRADGNHYDTDYSGELAAGDFDGDGRTDVFLANGTAWFFSRAGKKPWEFLHASTKRLHELGFADIDNDKITDVLYRDGAGNVGYLKSGRNALVPLTTAPVAMKDIRSGDFDGDGKTDLFFTHEDQWQVWYGSTRTWTATGSSGNEVSEFLFGEFDGIKGTDVATVLQSGWVYSSGSTGTWAPLNSKLTDSFKNAVAADFDGNGKPDIAFKKNGRWRISADGRGVQADLRNGDIELNKWIVGRFEPNAPAMAVHFDPPVTFHFDLRPPFYFNVSVTVAPRRFVIWRGLGSGNTLHPWSDYDMK